MNKLITILLLSTLLVACSGNKYDTELCETLVNQDSYSQEDYAAMITQVHALHNMFEAQLNAILDESDDETAAPMAIEYYEMVNDAINNDVHNKWYHYVFLSKALDKARYDYNARNENFDNHLNKQNTEDYKAIKDLSLKGLKDQLARRMSRLDEYMTDEQEEVLEPIIWPEEDGVRNVASSDWGIPEGSEFVFNGSIGEETVSIQLNFIGGHQIEGTFRYKSRSEQNFFLLKGQELQSNDEATTKIELSQLSRAGGEFGRINGYIDEGGTFRGTFEDNWGSDSEFELGWD